MEDNINNLTNSELERLAILQEECAEVQKLVGKIIRHGYESYHPSDELKVTNRRLLEKELGDLSFIVNFCADNEDINLMKVREFTDKKKDTISEFLRYNNV